MLNKIFMNVIMLRERWKIGGMCVLYIHIGVMDKKECANYRGISLQCILGKVWRSLRTRRRKNRVVLGKGEDVLKRFSHCKQFSENM